MNPTHEKKKQKQKAFTTLSIKTWLLESKRSSNHCHYHQRDYNQFYHLHWISGLLKYYDIF